MLPKKPYLQFKQKADGTIMGRFAPSPKLRRLGFKRFNYLTNGKPYTSEEWKARGFDTPLPVTKTGQAMSVEDCLHIAATVINIIEDQEATLKTPQDPATESSDTKSSATADGQGRRIERVHVMRSAMPLTLEAFFADYQRSEEFLDNTALATKRGYRLRQRHVADYFVDTPPMDIDTIDILDMYKHAAKTRGETSAFKMVSNMRLAFRWGRTRSRKWKPYIPDLDWRLNLPSPKERIRIASPGEQAALIRAADNPHSIYEELGRGPKRIQRRTPTGFKNYLIEPAGPMPSVADTLIHMAWTAQRESDILLAKWDWLYEHKHRTDNPDSLRIREGLRFRGSPSKTGTKHQTKFDIPILPPLLKRQTEIKQRQLAKGWRARGHIILSDVKGVPYMSETKINSTFSKNFAKVRNLAAEICPTVGDLHAQDYRDTAITNLARGGCDLFEIKSFSNHKTIESLTKILKHYMDIDGEFADRAGDKLMAQLGY